MLKVTTAGDTTPNVPFISALFRTLPLATNPTSYCTTLVPAVHANMTEPSMATTLLETGTYLGPPDSQVAEVSASANKRRLEETDGMMVTRM